MEESRRSKERRKTKRQRRALALYGKPDFIEKVISKIKDYMKKSRLKEIIREELNENQVLDDAISIIAKEISLFGPKFMLGYHVDYAKEIIQKLMKKGYEISKEVEKVPKHKKDYMADYETKRINGLLPHPRIGPVDEENTSPSSGAYMPKIKEGEKGAVKLKKDTPERDIKKYTDQGLDVELNEDKFNLVAKNLIQTEKDIKQLVKKLKKAEPGEKQSIAKLLKKKMEVKKELQSHKKQLDEDRK